MRLVTVAAVLLLATPASATPTLQSQSDPYPGIHRETWTDVDVRIRLIRVDLTSAEIALYATAEAKPSASTTSDYAARKNAQVAINGDAFAVNNFVPRGLAMGGRQRLVANRRRRDHRRVPHAPRRRAHDRRHHPARERRHVGRAARGHRGRRLGPPAARAPIARSRPRSTATIPITSPASPRRAPRSPCSPDGNTLWLAIVDGWQDDRARPDLRRARRVPARARRPHGDGARRRQLVDARRRRRRRHPALRRRRARRREPPRHQVRRAAQGRALRPHLQAQRHQLRDRRPEPQDLRRDRHARRRPLQTTDSTATYDFSMSRRGSHASPCARRATVTKTQCHQVIAGELQTTTRSRCGRAPMPPTRASAATAATPPDATTARDGGTDRRGQRL